MSAILTKDSTRTGGCPAPLGVARSLDSKQRDVDQLGTGRGDLLLRDEGLPAMSAIDERLAGKPGAAFVDLVRHVIRAVGPGDGFPAPEGHSRWDGSAVMTSVADFFASRQTVRRLKVSRLAPTTGR